MALTLKLDKASYVAGDVMTLTVTSDKRMQTDVIDIQSAGDDAKATTTIQAGITWTDSLGKKWTILSDNGTVATMTATA